jgi:MFS family permease
MFRALRHKNYRLFFIGQGISLTGTWMQQMAIGWLIYRLTKSPLMLGFVGFLGNIPTFIFTPFAGVLADRMNRHRMLIITQALEMIQALILAALIMTGKIEVWHIFALTIFLGIVIAFDSPARHAFVVEMVGKKEDLGNAIALNSLVRTCRAGAKVA